MPDNRLLFKFFPKISILVAIQALLLFSCSSQNGSLREAIEQQVKLYPASTLQDLYKSFFQDEFGPGHMAPDSAGAAGYLDYELSGMRSRGDYAATPCGAGLNFYRVPLDLVKDGVVPKTAYLSAFLESAKSFKTPEIADWRAEWARIQKEIESMDLQVPNFEADKKAIQEMLDRGETVVHHSDRFSQQYEPHYRIMKKEQWMKLEAEYLK